MAKAIPLVPDVRAVISELAIDGNVVRIERPLDRPLYERVNRILEALGGKWTRKVKGHVFPEDPAEKIENVLLTGMAVDLKKAYDFFETPPEVARQIVERAWLSAGMRVLEPSAGRGSICDAIREHAPTARIQACEILEENRLVLRGKGYDVIAADFFGLAFCPPEPPADPNEGFFDRVLMNPPFSGQQDIEHVGRAFGLLKYGGRLVSVMSAGVRFRTNQKTARFMDFVRSVKGEVEDLPEGSFKASGTSVNCVVVTLDRGRR